MAAVSSVQELDPRLIETYWELTRDVVSLFEGDPAVVDTLIANMADRPDEEQLLQYHREPLATAALLVFGDQHATKVTQDHRDGYTLLKEKYGWGTT